MKPSDCVVRFNAFLRMEEPVYTGQPDDAVMDDFDAGIGVAQLLAEEGVELIKYRKDSEIRNCFAEQEQTWHEFRRLLPDHDIPVHGFKIVCQSILPKHFLIEIGW